MYKISAVYAGHQAAVHVISGNVNLRVCHTQCMLTKVDSASVSAETLDIKLLHGKEWCN